MKICHVAIYTRNLIQLKNFYAGYFDGNTSELYNNKQKGFSSYFIRFESGASLELMTNSNGLRDEQKDEFMTGYAHIAFSVGNQQAVDDLTARIRKDGYKIASEPRVTGDGYYESCILDPDGNRVEITCD